MLLHGFVKVVRRISVSCCMDLLKLLKGFVKFDGFLESVL